MGQERMTVEEFKQLQKGSKYHAVPVVIDGIRFDSKAEGEFYKLLKLDKATLHIDVHPTITLPGGIRYKPDFIVHKSTMEIHEIESGDGWVKRAVIYCKKAEAIEIKGAITQDFRRMRKLFDATHPLAPLKVYQKTRRGWEEI